ncbi:hypothetical protein BH23GEM10_BH23GEM10_11790 [soil metagenome]
MPISRDVANACRIALTLVLVSGCAGDADTSPGDPAGQNAAEATDGRAPDRQGADAADPGQATSPVDSVTLVFSRGEAPATVRRAVEDPADVHQALALLVRGPTVDERAGGIHSWFSAETAGALRSVDVDADGHAVINFDGLDALIPNASSSAGSRLLLVQLNGTVFQFPEIESVEYRLGGSCDAFGEWLQTGCITQTRDARDARDEPGGGGDSDGGDDAAD